MCVSYVTGFSFFFGGHCFTLGNKGFLNCPLSLCMFKHQRWFIASFVVLWVKGSLYRHFLSCCMGRLCATAGFLLRLFCLSSLWRQVVGSLYAVLWWLLIRVPTVEHKVTLSLSSSLLFLWFSDFSPDHPSLFSFLSFPSVLVSHFLSPQSDPGRSDHR